MNLDGTRVGHSIFGNFDQAFLALHLKIVPTTNPESIHSQECSILRSHAKCGQNFVEGLDDLTDSAVGLTTTRIGS